MDMAVVMQRSSKEDKAVVMQRSADEDEAKERRGKHAEENAVVMP